MRSVSRPGGGLVAPALLSVLIGMVAAPAHSQPATVYSGPATWGPGSVITFQIDDATGTEGVNWSKNEITGSLTFSSGVTPGNRTTIAVESQILGTGEPGALLHFDPTQNYSWRFVTTTTGVNGYQPEKVEFDTSGFAPYNDLSGGIFSLSVTGTDLYLNYAAIPEPATVALALLALPAVLRKRRRPPPRV